MRRYNDPDEWARAWEIYQRYPDDLDDYITAVFAPAVAARRGILPGLIWGASADARREKIHERLNKDNDAVIPAVKTEEGCVVDFQKSIESELRYFADTLRAGRGSRYFSNTSNALLSAFVYAWADNTLSDLPQDAAEAGEKLVASCKAYPRETVRVYCAWAAKGKFSKEAEFISRRLLQ
jgi:hypothetical protein